jgi:nucleoside triphosphate diphosphatase
LDQTLIYTAKVGRTQGVLLLVIEVAKIEELLEIMRSLRDPAEGCPWDLEQTFASIVPHTIEEAYEVADCIERRGLVGLPEELGDLLFQVVFYAQLAAERRLFTFDDVVAGISRKLTVRHPHVFGGESVADAGEQTRRWEEHKAAERLAAGRGRRVGELDGVPLGLPALTRAKKLQQRAARVGFDWPDPGGPRQKVVEEIDELDDAIATGESRADAEEELGDLLFACVNWARHLGIEPESALRAATRKFERRFGYIEAALDHTGVGVADASLATMEDLWEEAKLAERRRG